MDAARTNSQWSEVSELSRKVAKHSLEDTCELTISNLYISFTNKKSPAFASSANIEAQALLLLNQHDIDYLTPHEVFCQSQIDELASQMRALVTKVNDPPEQQLMYSTIFMHFLLLQGKYSEVTDRYTTSNFSRFEGSYKFNYSHVLAIKECAIVGTAYEAQNMFAEAIKVYEGGNQLIKDSISKYKEGLIWAEKLYYRFGMLATSLTWDDQSVTLTALHGYQNVWELIHAYPTVIAGDSASVQRRLSLLNLHFLYLSSVLQRNPEDAGVKKEVQRVSKLFQDTLFQSTALITSKASNIPIEQFIDGLFKNWLNTMHLHGPLGLVVEKQDIIETNNLLKVLRQASMKTFHSCAIMRYLVFVLTALGQYEEALSAFNTYVAYQEKARIRQASYKTSSSVEDISPQSKQLQSGDDDKSVVGVFSKAIDVMVIVKKDGNMARNTADRLRSWLNNETFISSRGKNRKRQGHDRNISSTSSVISADLRDGFALVWASIGRAYALYAYQANTSEEREQVYELAVSSYESSLGYHPEDAQIYFDFALLLAQNSQLKHSMRIVREGLMVDKSHVLLWHLIGLLLSAMEDYEKALQAVSNALGMFSEKSKSSPSSLLDLEKSQYLQVKMTEVAIYEASEGIDRALELIPDVFSLYGELHPPAETKEAVPEVEEDYEIVPTKSRLFIKNLKPGLGLSRTLSRTPFRGHKKDHSVASTNVSVPRLSTASRVAPPSLPHLTDKASRKDLNKLWLWTAGLYRRGGLSQDAEEALLEAEKVGGLSADARVELGLLIKKERPALALKEFEAALEIDKDNIRAIVAFVNLIYDHSESQHTESHHTEPKENVTFNNPFGEEFNDEDEFNPEPITVTPNGNGQAQNSRSQSHADSKSKTSVKNQKTESAHDSIFISHNDQLAAGTRAQGLLEMLLQSGRGFNCSEGWWLMSLTKEREGDKIGAAAALWKCVGLEESRGVRGFSVLEY